MTYQDIIASYADLRKLAGVEVTDNAYGDVMIVCRDLNNDCRDFRGCEGECWTKDPGRGFCPFMVTQVRTIDPAREMRGVG